MQGVPTLPTKTAVAIANASSLGQLFNDRHKMPTALGHFQRMALVADYGVAIRTFVPFIDLKLTDQHVQCLKLIHEIAKQDVLGLAMQSLAEVVQKSPSSKDRVAAAAVLDTIFNTDTKVETNGISDKLVVNLVTGSTGKTSS